MESSAVRRKAVSIALGGVLVLLIGGMALLNNHLGFVNPSTTDEILVLTGLSALVFLVFVAVLVMLVRNVLKVYADHRSRVMGSRLRTRMLWGAVLVSLLPIAFMATFSYVLMNRAVDRWFSNPVMEMRDQSNQMALELSQYTTANARAEADSIAASLANLRLPEADHAVEKDRTGIQGVLRQHEITLQGGFCVVFQDGRPIASFHLPSGEKETGQLEGDVLAIAQRTDQPLFKHGQAEYVLGTAGLGQGGLIVVGMPMPYGMTGTVKRLRDAAETYVMLFRNRRQIRAIYMQLLLMMTSLALFVVSWLALHLSKQVTRPVEALADAMDQIAAGDYAHRVQESATEELGDLVHSFNRMVADLESSRSQLHESTLQISQANATLEARRGELETMLQTIPNGVATLNADRRIVLANRALSEMVDPGGQRPFLGATIEEILPEEVIEVLDRLIKRSHRMGSASSELEMTTGGETLNLLATVALLETMTGTERVHRGYVLVLEDATELLRAQRQSAWKEVARRVAHEIKNPLTPISLSAEQIHRHIVRLRGILAEREIESPSPAVIERCSEVITASVESMRSLVDQFSALAEFPTARPRPADLNTIVENSLAIFAGRLQNIRLVRKLANGLPLVMADPEALKRALGNLIDNAAEAMQQSLLRELRVTTSVLESGMVELTVADTGAGLTDEMRERLFLPYFSTKQRGTGLGLAIAAKIVQEHQGTIRAERNLPAGAKFIVELRQASATETFEGEKQTDAVSDPVGGRA